MNYFELYKSRVQQNGINYAEAQRNKAEKNISRVFKKSPSYYEKEIVDLEGNINIKGVQIFDNNSLSKTNTTNQKCVLMQPNDKLECGYIVKDYDNLDWICIEKDNLIIDKGIIEECNMTLKWISPNDKITIHNISAFQSNMSLYSIGTNENKYFVTEDGKRFIIIPMNNKTNEVYIGQRFILGQNVFSVTEIYDGKKGIYELKLQQTDKLPDKDRFDLGIAYNGFDLNIPQTNTSYIIQIIGSNTVQANYKQSYTAKIYDNGIEVTDKYIIWTIDNPTNASLTSNVNTCEIQGIMQDTYINLTAKLSDDNSILCTKQIYIGGSW